MLVLIGVASGVLYVFYWLGGYWMIGGTIMGIATIPLVGMLFGSFPFSGILANILVAMGNVTNNGSVLVYDEYESRIVPYDHDAKRIWWESEWHEIDQDELTTYRVGLRPFGVTMDPEKAFEEYRVDMDISNAPMLIDEQRAGHYTFAPYNSPEEDDGWFLVDWMRFIERVGRSGTRLYNRAEEDALKKYAGNDRLSQLTMVVLALGNMVVMFVMTWIMLSL